MELKALCKFAGSGWHRKIFQVMKLTAALILLACLQVSAKGFTQESITLSEKNAPLQKVFKKIKQQTGYYFVHRDEWLREAHNVDIEVKNAPLEEVLAICFRNQPLTYTIIGKTIIIKKKEEVKNTGSPEVASPIDVKGRVVNEKGEPVEGVTVTVKGTKIATATDANGEFSLKMVDQNATLVFTSVNMERFEVNVNGQAELLINLKTKVSTLQDVVINKGYYSTSQRLNTGNVSRVTAETISDQPVGNPLEALQARIPGSYIQQSSGIPGGPLVAQLRGRYSLA